MLKFCPILFCLLWGNPFLFCWCLGKPIVDFVHHDAGFHCSTVCFGYFQAWQFSLSESASAQFKLVTLFMCSWEDSLYPSPLVTSCRLSPCAVMCQCPSSGRAPWRSSIGRSRSRGGGQRGQGRTRPPGRERRRRKRPRTRTLSPQGGSWTCPETKEVVLLKAMVPSLYYTEIDSFYLPVSSTAAAWVSSPAAPPGWAGASWRCEALRRRSRWWGREHGVSTPGTEGATPWRSRQSPSGSSVPNPRQVCTLEIIESI